MTGRERVSEHLDGGRRYRVRESSDGAVTVERREHDGWQLLDDREARAVVDRLSGRPENDQQP
ncbi:hypothetical protein SAMN05216207_104645 [Pseudonocardia ammonioxydans]|uniref:Uncharacterized protein n=1 Tax=Pseudonocardia ammonioxydans TaxID=260086 RepID=A0A1I5GGU9_PSUAM|nr:hypothetical protein [Pseudonocardia ammonioxydans]SFO35116.1 hypothetical protein SAMN05216207_104645 [Pseudonocardia ammonioxydans]